jgi:hypothetical protein
LHKVIWDLQAAGGNGTLVSLGDYVARIKVGDRELTKKLRVEGGQ